MTSKIWVKGCKHFAVVGTISGLLLTGLPLLAAPSTTLAGDLPDGTEIAQTSTYCIEEHTSVKEFLTENYAISICEDGNSMYALVHQDNGTVYTLHDVTTTRNGEYIATTTDQDGSELVYTIGAYLRITNNGDQVVNEETF